MDLLEITKAVLQWIVVPLVAFVYMMHEKIGSLHTKTAVLESELRSQKALNEQTYSELRSNFTTIVSKLDSIEQFLRK